MTDLGTFTCAVCNETFDKIHSEEEVREEYERIWDTLTNYTGRWM